MRKKFARSAFPAQRFTPAARGFFFSFSALVSNMASFCPAPHVDKRGQAWTFV